MSLTLREENFVVIDLGSYLTKAGIGANDTNKPPSVIVSNADFNNPIKDEEITSWEDLENLLQHVLFQEIGIKKSRNDSPVLLTVPQSWTKEQLERLVQIFFENFNAPGVYIATQPLMALYGCGVVTGLVVDIGHNTTNVSIAVDSCLQLQSNFSSAVAGKELTAFMLRSMEKDDILINEFKKHSEESGEEIKLNEEFARYVKELPGVCNVLVGHEIEENLLSVEIPASIVSTPSAAKEDTPAAVDAVEEQDALKKIPDREEIEYKGKKFTIGRYRHRVFDPLFDPSLVGSDSMSLADMIRTAVHYCEPLELRPKLMDNIVLTGGGSMMSGAQRRLKSEMIPFNPVSDNAGDLQPRSVKFVRIPEYFTVLKEAKYQQYASWLGGLIVAKLVFIDPKNYISKLDYNESGPAVVHLKSY
ncbi:hypothetical protein INT44_007306 [Umbelopsis vinacea]|uniref:Actin n=1 Tax=Umbelopsis vinacea TaxID=44442 RepID=A0A8H7PMA8_9FUNG|nr:hypothetical protein INT44_007306 [Umbelopsis vinacea]KAI9286518.1 actin family [Umbelopsis sp. AD052]